jgi:hypothetical protein
MQAGRPTQSSSLDGWGERNAGSWPREVVVDRRGSIGNPSGVGLYKGGLGGNGKRGPVGRSSQRRTAGFSLAIATDCYTILLVGNESQIAAALRQIGRGFHALADAVASETAVEGARELAILREWGDRGLSRAEASALFRKHGMAPQAAGGWARAEWIESRDDGRRYLTERSRQWVASQEEHDV